MHRWILPLVLIPALALAQPEQSRQYRRMVTTAARAYGGLNAPVPMYASQIHQESMWRASARSRAGALGLAQFMPGTAQWMASIVGPGDPLNPAWAVQAMVAYDGWLYDRAYPYETVCDRWAFALSGYNGGEKWRQRRQAASWAPGSYKITGYINPGITASNQRENQSYAPKILLDLQRRYASWGPSVDCEGILR